MKLTGNRCECSGCGRFFNSPKAFDSHRSGPATSRFCLDPAEIGMVLNSAGFWITEEMPLRKEPVWADSTSGKQISGTISEIPGIRLPEPERA